MGEKTIYLVLDLVRGGELFDRIIQNEYFNERDASEVTKQLLEALQYMHERGCAHRDIKVTNETYTDLFFYINDACRPRMCCWSTKRATL